MKLSQCSKSQRLSLAIQWDKALGALVVQRQQIRRWVQSSLQQPAELTLRFVGQEEGLRLNQQYRKKKYATNVLTFILNQPSLIAAEMVSAPSMADIVICIPVVEREAIEQNKLLTHHLAHMIMHGVLHAQGYDHIKKQDAMVMESLEIEILKRFRIPNPYEISAKP